MLRFREKHHVRAALAILAASVALFGSVIGATASSAATSHTQASPPETQGTYTATLGSLNANANGGKAVTGTATLTIQGDMLNVTVDAQGLSPNEMHMMHIHTGGSCPTAAADANHDGYVDVVEGVPSYGLILVPLTSDLTHQGAGMSPMTDANGNLHYTASVSLTTLLADLHMPQADPSSPVVKLKAGEALNLAAREIVIHGVVPSTNLPSTVQSLPGAPATATIPMACGSIKLQQAAATPTPTTPAATPTAAPTTPAPAGTSTAQGPAETQGTYTATLGSLNASANGGTGVTGTATLTIKGDMLNVTVDAHGLSPNVMHMMHIHTGPVCPTQAADKNGDGFVDVIEGVPSYGLILVPLTSDLTHQGAGMSPMTDANGNLHYTASVSLTTLLADLHMPQADPSSPIVKLKAGEALNLAAREIVIHGVATNLPATVQSLPGAPANATIPVACGSIHMQAAAVAPAAPSTGSAGPATTTSFDWVWLAAIGLIAAAVGGTAVAVRARR